MREFTHAARYDHDESDEVAHDIALDSEGNVYVCGTTDGNGTQRDTLVGP